MTNDSYIKIKDILENSIKENSIIKVRGWIYRTRSSGNIVFIMLRDSTGYLQATIKKGNLPPKICPASWCNSKGFSIVGESFYCILCGTYCTSEGKIVSIGKKKP